MSGRGRRAVGVGFLAAVVGLAGVPAIPSAGAAVLPSLTVGDVTAVEGDSGIANLKVSVDLSTPSAVTVKVPFAIVASNDGATSAADARMRNGTVTFLPGQTTKVVAVNSVGDNVVEPDQHVLVLLGQPVGGTATIADAIGVVTLVDDDANGVPAGIEVSVGDVVVGEADAGLHKGYIPVTLSKPATVKTKVAFALDCQTVDLLDDITIKKSGTMTFAPGQRVKYIAFSIPADVKPEVVAEAVQRISTTAASVKVLDTRGDVIVNDDDGGPALPTYTANPVPGFTTAAIPSGSSYVGPAVGTIEQVTLTPAGGQPASTWADPMGGNFISGPRSPSTSYDGRYVAFSSEQADLVPGDTNNLPDVFVRDRETGTTERVSLKSDGSQVTQSDHMSGASPLMWDVRISADGRYVAFDTSARLVPTDTYNGPGWTEHVDVYVFDRVTRTTRPASVDSSGQWIHGMSPEISANGRYVLFEGGIDEPGKYVYVRDMQTGTTTMVYDHGLGGAMVSNSALSANGRYAVIISEGRLCYDQQLLLVDLLDGSTERVDVTDEGEGAAQEDGWAAMMYSPTVSADGRYVAFKSHSWNLIPGMGYPGVFNGPGAFNSNLIHVYVRDLVERSTTLVGLGPNGQLPAPTFHHEQLALSGDGRKLAVGSWSSDEGRGTIHDLASGTRSTLGYPYSPAHMGALITPAAMSGDGRFVAFSSHYRVTDNVHLGNAFAQRVP